MCSTSGCSDPESSTISNVVRVSTCSETVTKTVQYDMVFQLCCKQVKHNHPGKINTGKTEHIPKALKIILIANAPEKSNDRKVL